MLRRRRHDSLMAAASFMIYMMLPLMFAGAAARAREERVPQLRYAAPARYGGATLYAQHAVAAIFTVLYKRARYNMRVYITRAMADAADT